MKKILPPILSLLIVYLADELFFPIEDEHLRDSGTFRNRFFIRSYFQNTFDNYLDDFSLKVYHEKY